MFLQQAVGAKASFKLKEYLHDCVTEGLQCQEARWQSAVRSGTAGEQQPDGPHQREGLVVSGLTQDQEI